MEKVSNADILRRENLLALSGLLAVVAVAWAYLWLDAARTSPMPMGTGAGLAAGAMSPIWSMETFLLTFLMWSSMMVGMMLPSAAPAVLLYGSMARKNRERGFVLPPVWIFTTGYLAIWTGFSLAATILQYGLHAGALLTPMMVSNSTWLTGGLLIVAGIYQWLPVKEACLQKCRAPLHFFLFHWRPGRSGTFRMGIEHGVYCVGCCWALMLLLFTAGVMNLVWVAAIAAFVFLEKLMPGGPLIGRLAGIALAAFGMTMMISGG